MPRVLAALVLCFSLLAAEAWAQAPGAAPRGAVVAFDFPQEKQILFPITINGIPAEAWLDSGASATVVDAAYARAIGLPLEGGIRARGVSGQVGGVRLAQAQISMGATALPPQRVAVMDLSAVARVVPRPIQVIVGREFFQDAIVQIDFSRRRLALMPREPFQPPSVAPLPLHASGSLRSVQIRIGEVQTDAIVDLGNAGALLLDRRFAESRGLLKGRPSSTQLSIGADGPRESLVTTLDDVHVGGVSFDRVGTVATASLASHAPANIGLEILSRFNVTLDFAGDRIWLEPLPGAAAAPFRKNRAGVALVPEADHVRVSHVAPGSPAAAARLRVGDQIATIDGQPVGGDYAASDLSRWIFGPAGRQVTLTLANGRRRTVKLADYY